MKHGATAAAALALATPGVTEAQERRSVAPEAMQKIAPVLTRYTDDVLFGDVWLRPGLSPRDRSIVTLSVLIATGKTAQLGGHLNRGLTNGLKPTEVAGVVTHLALYTGWPNAVSALTEVDKVFTDRKIDPATLKAVVPTTAPLPASDGERAATVRRDVAPIAPKFAELTNGLIFNDLWRRTDLNQRDRSLVTIAALAAGGDDEQLGFHIKRALENGLTQPQISEAFTHLAFYAGWPKASAAIGILANTAQPGDGAGAPKVRVVPPGANPTPGPAKNFMGSVSVTSPFKGTGAARVGGATVTFRPGGRTNWHRHPLGQLLVVTAGEGRVQADGEGVRAIRPGDTVWIGPGVKHWHGAAPTKAMTHVAVSETEGGNGVSWLEPVTDDVYRQSPSVLPAGGSTDP
ncbi:(R)-mandelonitrile lyase [Sphingomonas pituitosa]|uniref:(R)-mandelonitrile lyase n=1 Tax=Sphingomonas pituitosa TaxID=99597 RepID=UPI00083189DD|nr:carboxymuconolactone decarboxylase family protein [Sphingomonas pituitosa]